MASRSHHKVRDGVQGFDEINVSKKLRVKIRRRERESTLRLMEENFICTIRHRGRTESKGEKERETDRQTEGGGGGNVRRVMEREMLLMLA